MTSLPFAYRKESEAFGQLVRDHHHDLNDKNDSKIKVISREEILRMANGEIDQDHYEQIAGQESRLHPKTVEARTNRNQIKIPERITKSIYNHMLALRLPKILRYQVAQTYIKLQDSQVYEPTRKPHENDVHIAAFFTQDYASTYQVLKELFQRKPDFNPKKVLDIGYGPATGMIALNEIMGAEFEPQVKDSLIIGHHGMQDRAKILLSRQLNEYPGALEDLFTEEEMAEGLRQDEDILFDDFIGEVKTNKIKVKTKLLDHMSPTKKYDLIIAQHQLLQDPNRFPYEVDENVDLLLKSLEPNGYLVLVERGTPLGFEAIARARQVMIRPERYENESGKIPRPYLKGSTSKPNSNIFKEFEELQYDESLDDSELAKELNAKFGEVSEDDLKFEDDILEGAEVLDELPEAPKIDYHISIVAPCSHHKKCPLQTLKPQYYTYPSGKKLQWCHFDKSVERPRFLLELKRGQVLSSRWERNGEISPGRGSGGSGRPDANNFELATYSYLIAERSGNDPVTIDEIEVERENNTHDYKVGSVTEEINLWPRIMQNPLKRKGHVTMSLCGTSGEIEKWTVTKSFDRIAYHDARKAHAGDLWPLNAKTKLQGRSNQDEALQVKLENYEKELMLKEKKEKRLTSKKSRKEFQLKAAEFTQRDNESPEEMVHVYTTKFNMSKRQRQKDSRGGLDQFYN
jgi:ribosomal protein RSM22 (predicted rRNA methylase)